MASLSKFYSFRKRESSGSDGPLDEKNAQAPGEDSQDNKSESSRGGKGNADVEESEATSPGALSLEEGAVLVVASGNAHADEAHFCRCCWRSGPSPWRVQLHHAYVRISAMSE